MDNTLPPLKRIAAIHDLSGLGKCSLTVALPVISATGVECACIPTAVLSTHTGEFTGWTRRDLTDQMLPIARHWASLDLDFDGIYSGYLASPEQALLVSPVVDMEALITNMMQYAHVTEEQLHRAGEIPTDLGETLSWPYLCWVREHPLHWHGRTQVLYGDRDALTSRTMIERFRQESGAHLTIMEGGEHWFHTPVQMAVLQTWEETNV